MATKTQVETFIKHIAPFCQEAYATLGKVKPSVAIGMACVESGYGTEGSCKYNSFFGQKVGTGKTATKYWDGTFKSWKTTEEYTIGKNTVITDAFRTYSSMKQCVFNFYELLNSKVYNNVKDTDYVTQMRQIKACKYMTSSKEVNSVISIIKKYNLTQYDIQNKPLTVLKYQIGQKYTLQNNMYIRETPGGKDLDILNKGSKIVCKSSTTYKGGIWIQCERGWICGIGMSGKVYVC